MTRDLPSRYRRPLPLLASALAAGALLAVAACSGHIAPLNSDQAPVSLPPPRDLGWPIVMQVMRGQPPTPAGQCPVGSVDLFGLEPNVPRASAARAVPVPAHGSTPSPAPTPTPPATAPAGVACYRPVGRPVTVTSAAVSPVSTFGSQPGPAMYGFVVAFPAGDVAALTALVRQAQDSGDATGITVAGKLWQAPQPRQKILALRGVQVTLLSRSQALQLYHLLVPPG